MGRDDGGTTTETAVYKLTRVHRTALIATLFTLSPGAMQPRYHQLARLRSTAPKLRRSYIYAKKRTNVQIRGAAAS